MAKRKKIKSQDCMCERPGIKAFGSRTRCSKCGGMIILSPEMHQHMDYLENVVFPETEAALQEEMPGVWLTPGHEHQGEPQVIRLSFEEGELKDAKYVDDEK